MIAGLAGLYFIAGKLGLRLLGVCDSPLLGPAGNKEFLALLEKLG